MTLIIKNFSEHYEKADTRKVKEMKWLSLPIKFDGLKYRRIMKMSDGMEIFGVWIVLLQVSSKMPVRGTLATADGDLTLSDIVLMTDCPLKSLKKAIPVLCSDDIGWVSDDHQNFSDDRQPTLQNITLQNITLHNITKHNEDFEKFRKIYPGTKNGFDKEFQNLKKHNNWKNIIPLLFPAIELQIKNKEDLKRANKFCPEWKHLGTWINNQCWTEEPAVVESNEVTITIVEDK